VAVEIVAFFLGLGASLYVVGWIVDWIRLAAARLPIDIVSSFSNTRILGDGLRVTAVALTAFAVLSLLAYLTSAHRWEVNGQDWHDLVEAHGVENARSAPDARERRGAREKAASDRIEARATRRAELRKELADRVRRRALRATTPNSAAEGPPPLREAVPKPARPAPAKLGEAGVRIIAGFNIMTFSALAGAGAAVLVDEFIEHAWWTVLPGWIAVFLLARHFLTKRGPLQLPARVHGAAWLLLAAAAALFASAPLGVLVLVAVAMSTLGRAVARWERPTSVRGWIESPLPWLLFTVVALIGLAYTAIPPVSFPGAIVTTTAGTEQSGGYLARTAGGVLMASCRQRADATSTDERVVFVPSSSVKTITLGGRTQVFDTGDRASLVGLGEKALGLDQSAPKTISLDLRPRSVTCVGGAPAAAPGSEEGSLDAGVIEGSPPPGGRALDGEPPIGGKTPTRIAELALRYQPTVEVAAADRSWPVSVGSLLSGLGPGETPTCLIQRRAPGHLCAPSPSSLEGGGSVASDYLQYPVHLRPDSSPNLQLEAFERGQNISPGSLEQWLPHPQTLKPWATAQVYFYYAGVLRPSQWPEGVQDARLPERLETLEYWFFYQYNYFPLVVRSNLMQDAPIAADLLNVDFHQGDWEHIDVLLDPSTHTPLWVYMARHSGEGQFFPWGSAPLVFEKTHPIIRAAFGGHPSYPPNCGQQRRPKTRYALSDWLVCGTQFAFLAKNTPLVDIARTPWACWNGHFGEAIPGVEVNNANEPESVLDQLTHQVWVAGPQSPLRQAENTGVCSRDPTYPESSAR
jgi:hypothetical protein